VTLGAMDSIDKLNIIAMKQKGVPATMFTWTYKIENHVKLNVSQKTREKKIYDYFTKQ
jgi:hypothetical protein